LVCLEGTGALLHPLLRIAFYNVVFLAIHPFQDGNGQVVARPHQSPASARRLR